MKLNLDVPNLNPLTSTANYFGKFPEDGGLMVGGTCFEYCMQYRTDPEALSELMVEPYTVGDDPIVTVLYSWFEGNALLQYKDYPNGDYAISVVGGNCKFDGKKDHITGIYNFIMPENNNYCVLMGRDHGGAPKIFTDIPRAFMLSNGHTICEPRAWTYDEKGEATWKTLYRVDFGPFTKADDATAKLWETTLNNTLILQYKFVPGNWNGAEVSYAMKTSYFREIDELYVADTAEFTLGTELNKRSQVLENRLLDAFRTLPVKELVAAVHWKGRIWLGAEGGPLE